MQRGTMPVSIMPATAAAEARTSWNKHINVITAGGFGTRRSVMSPNTASVPSLPTSSAVTS